MKVQQAIETIILYGQECRKAQGQLLSSQKEAVTAALSWFLETQDKEALSQLAQAGVAMRNRCCGPRLAVRGLVEFSSYCGNTCLYCGLNRGNSQAERYRLTKEEILTCASAICKAQIGTMVLQSGEDGTKAEFLEEVLRSVKAAHPNLAITLSVGERRAEDYSRWKAAGADRFLLRIESSDPELYASLHQGRRVETRIQCLDTLQALGYQTGSGLMIGVPGQATSHIVKDLLFFAEKGYDMVGIGPFIPHPDTPFRHEKAGSVDLTLRTVSLARLLLPEAWIPATTALGSMDRDYRLDALMQGANVVMPNFSPDDCKKKYAIYPGKRCISEENTTAPTMLAPLAAAAGLTVDTSRADAPRMG